MNNKRSDLILSLGKEQAITRKPYAGYTEARLYPIHQRELSRLIDELRITKEN